MRSCQTEALSCLSLGATPARLTGAVDLLLQHGGLFLEPRRLHPQLRQGRLLPLHLGLQLADAPHVVRADLSDTNTEDAPLHQYMLVMITLSKHLPVCSPFHLPANRNLPHVTISTL